MRKATPIGPLERAPWPERVLKLAAALAVLSIGMSLLPAGLVSMFGGSRLFWILLMLGSIVVLGVGSGVLRVRRMHRINDRSRETVAMLNAGRVDEARAEFERLAKEAKGLAEIEVMCHFNLAMARMRGGELRAASEVFEALLEAGWFERRSLLFERPIALGAAALAAALQGRLDRAQHWIEHGDRVVPEAMRGVLLPAKVVVALRSGEVGAALRMFETERELAEAVLPASSLRRLDLLHAFAAAHAPTSSYRGDPVPALDWRSDVRDLCVAWPELQAFVEAQRPRASTPQLGCPRATADVEETRQARSVDEIVGVSDVKAQEVTAPTHVARRREKV